MTEQLQQLLENAYNIKNNSIGRNRNIPFEIKNEKYIEWLFFYVESGYESKKFGISKKAYWFLLAMIWIYDNSDGIHTQFITIDRIRRFFHPDRILRLGVVFRDSIFELEEKNIIEIKNIDHYLIKFFYESDRIENDYYMLPIKPSFIPFGNKKFGFTESFMQKLNQL